MRELLEKLRKAAEGEHAAIVQYLYHAYAIGEGEEACEIEAIARDEMRHFWVLSRWIVKLGGVPSIERGGVDLAGEDATGWMGRDVEAEEKAIAMYRSYIPEIEDPGLRSDVERILFDEEHHRDQFAHFAGKFGSLPAEESPRETAQASAAELEALDWGIRHEYAAVLQYLFHSFLSQDEETSRQLELQAVNEMQHMGWLAEEMASRGRGMPLEHHEVDLSQEPSSMLRADVKLERDTADMYEKFLQKLGDPGLRKLLERIRGHELYHERLFTRLLKRPVPTC